MRMLSGLLMVATTAFSMPGAAASSFITIPPEQAGHTPSIVSAGTPPGLDADGVAAIPANPHNGRMAPMVMRAGEIGTSAPLDPAGRAAEPAAKGAGAKAEAAPEPPAAPTQQPR